jgi:PAS domain S-box-containing protein
MAAQDQKFVSTLSKNEQSWLKAHPSVIILVTKDWPPYEYIDSTGAYNGYSAEYIKFLCEKIGVKIKIKNEAISWKQLQDSLIHKKVDILPSIFETPERKNFLLFTESYLDVNQVITIKNSNDKIHNIKDLKNVPTGFMDKWAIQQIFKKEHPEIPQVLSDTTEQLLSNVLFGKTEAAVLDLATLSYLQQKHNISSFKIAFTTDYTLQLSMAVRNDWPEMRNILNKGQKYYARELKEIHNKWFNLINPEQRFRLNFLIWSLVIAGGILFVSLLWIFFLRRSVTKQTLQLQEQIKISNKNAEKLKMSELRYRSLFEAAGDAIMVMDGNTCIDCNKKAEEFYGTTKEELLGKTPVDYSPVYQPNGTLTIVHATQIIEKAQNGEYITCEWLGRKADGSLIFAEMSVCFFELNGKKLLNVILRDITERKKIETELQNYQENLERLVKEKTEEYDVVNQELTATNEELTATNEELALANDDLNILIQRLENEIKQHHETQLMFRESEEKFRNFIYQSSEGVIISKPDGSISIWNQKMEQITGIKESDAINYKMWEIAQLITDKDKESHVQQLKEYYGPFRQNSVTKAISKEVNILLSNGKRKTIFVNQFPINTTNNSYIGDIVFDITEKKRIEEELENYRVQLENIVVKKTDDLMQLYGRFNDVFENTSDAFCFFDLINERCILSTYNPVMKKLVGKECSDDHAPDLAEIFPPETANSLYKMVSECLKNETVLSQEIPIKFENDNKIIDIQVIPDTQTLSEKRRIAMILRDNTERRKMENLVVESESRFQTLVENLPFEFWFEYSDGRYSYINPLTDRKWIRGTGKLADNPDIPQHIKNSWEHNSSRSYKGELVHEETSYAVEHPLHFLNILSPIHLDDNIIGIIGMSIDISKQKLAEQKLFESEEKFYKIFNTSLDALSLVDYLTGNYVEINQGFTKIIGYQANEVLGKSRKELSLWYDDNTRMAYDKLMETQGSIRNMEMRWKIKGEKAHWFLVSSEFIEINGSKHILTISRDINEKYEIERALRVSERKFRNIFQSSKDGIVIISDNHEFLETNPAFLEIIGYTEEEIKNKNVYEIIPPKYQEQLKLQFEALLRQENIPVFEFEIETKDKQLVVVEISCLFLEYEERPALLVLLRNITNRKQIEQRLHELTVEIEEIERRKLAADLHDEVGPLLSSMNLYLSSLARKPEVQVYNNHIENISRILKDAITSVREISNNLSPHVLSNYGLEAALSAFFDTKRNLIKVNFENNIQQLRLPQATEIMLYRIVKELFNNTLKHSEATIVDVKLIINESSLFFNYHDNGKGFDHNKNEQTKGLGMVSVVNRAKTLGGNYRIITAKDKGFSFELNVTLNNLQN